MVQPLHIKNARVWDITTGAIERDLYTTDVVLDKPHPDAIEVDLGGYTIFPGLINAHDHLELNHYPRTKFREVYNNAHEWGEDVDKRLNDEPFKSLRAYPLKDRLFIGGLKNLLCGATTVAHHGPPHKPMYHKDFPVRVLKNYGWAHSLHFSTEEEIIASYCKTPKDWPWFIHLAEGTDEVAASEYQRLKALGCVGKNTVIVHGVGLRDVDVAHALHQARGLVWCPSTNLYLLGKAENIFHRWGLATVTEAQQRINPYTTHTALIAMGSDSRLTADSDLLGEMRAAVNIRKITLKQRDVNYDYQPNRHMYGAIVQLVTCAGANLLGLPHAGQLGTDAYADWISIRAEANAAKTLCKIQRCNLCLVVKGGVPQIGDPDVMAKFPHIETVRATLDGVPKAIQIDFARRIQKCSLKESGLELIETPGRRFFLF